MLHAMIMAGGGGTRFWPRSRQQRPKQFLTLGSDRTLLQQAMDRIELLLPAEHAWVITGEAYREETARQLPQLPADQIVGEPFGRDTAPCVGLGAVLIARRDPQATILVTPADHVIEPAQELRRAVQGALGMLEEYPSALVTFGITPTFPATGYGYIQRGKELASRQGVQIRQVERFHEKPELPKAEELFRSGGYLWNSGIFVWKAAAILDELRRQQPALHQALEHIASAWNTAERSRVLRHEYEKVTRTSIDKAVMEHAREVLVVQAPFGWDDVGSWLALERLHPQDGEGNTVLATHCGLKTKRCVIVGEPGRLITTIGVEDLLIIQDGDAILVADRRDEGTVKQLVEQLKSKNLGQYL